MLKNYCGKITAIALAAVICGVSIVDIPASAAGTGQDIPASAAMTGQTDTKEEVRQAWKESAILAPASGELVPAGSITIEWQALSGLSYQTLSYRVYLDEKLCQEVQDNGEEEFSCEVYTTATAPHSVRIEAVLAGEHVVTANVRTFFVSKKGLGIPTESQYMMQDMGASWYYNWSSRPDDRVKDGLDFVPMIWNMENDSRLLEETVQNCGTVLGYNEPDRTDQANISAEIAAGQQHLFTESGLRVGAPAASYPPSWNNEWFAAYADAVNWDEIDFIPIHCYMDWADGTADTLLKAVDETYKTYGKPIWITEFAIARWDADYPCFNGTDTEKNQEVADYMKEVIDGLEKRDYVERYAWQHFDVGDYAGGASALYDNNDTEGTLTDLGRLYRASGNPAGYVLPEPDGTEKEQSVSDVPVEDEWKDTEDVSGDEKVPGDGKGEENQGTSQPGSSHTPVQPAETPNSGTSQTAAGDDAVSVQASSVKTGDSNSAPGHFVLLAAAVMVLAAAGKSKVIHIKK